MHNRKTGYNFSESDKMLRPINPGSPYIVPINLDRDLTGETITARIAIDMVNVLSVDSATGGVTIANQVTNRGDAIIRFDGASTGTLPFKRAKLVVCLTDAAGDTYVCLTEDLNIEWPPAC